MRWLVCLAIASALAVAAPKPDFSGEWVLNLDRSEFGGQTPPKKLSQKIDHKEPVLKLDQSEVSPLDQAVKFQCTYTTGGKEVSNNVLGSVVKAIAKWDGEELLIHSWSEFGAVKVEMNDRWRLAENGATLIVTRQGSGAGGKIEQILVLDKQEPPTPHP